MGITLIAPPTNGRFRDCALLGQKADDEGALPTVSFEAYNQHLLPVMVYSGGCWRSRLVGSRHRTNGSYHNAAAPNQTFAYRPTLTNVDQPDRCPLCRNAGSRLTGNNWSSPALHAHARNAHRRPTQKGPTNRRALSLTYQHDRGDQFPTTARISFVAWSLPASA